MKSIRVVVNDLMQSGYAYDRIEPVGRNFDEGFEPELSPRELLALGVFGGRYMTDCAAEFPETWFRTAKLSPAHRSPSLNYFKVDASQPLKEWRRKGWIRKQDPRGWFQWYCRYYSGRRSEDDSRQIRRWRQMARHIAQVEQGCIPLDLDCRPRQRQALLHWAYDSRRI